MSTVALTDITNYFIVCFLLVPTRNMWQETPVWQSLLSNAVSIFFFELKQGKVFQMIQNFQNVRHHKCRGATGSQDVGICKKIEPFKHFGNMEL